MSIASQLMLKAIEQTGFIDFNKTLTCFGNIKRSEKIWDLVDDGILSTKIWKAIIVNNNLELTFWILDQQKIDVPIQKKLNRSLI